MKIQAYAWMKNPRRQSILKDAQFNSRTIVVKMVIKLNRWHSLKQMT